MYYCIIIVLLYYYFSCIVLLLFLYCIIVLLSSPDCRSAAHNCRPSARLTTFAFKSSDVSRLLLDLDSSGGTDPLGMLPLFLKRYVDVLGPRLSVMFRQLVRQGSFAACSRQANVTPMPKSPPSSSVANYLPISITSALSKVFERLHGVGSSRTIYGTQRCASNHPVCLSEL